MRTSTNLQLTSSMSIVTLEELKGVNPVFAGATFLEGDTVYIPQEPQLSKERRPNGSLKIYIGVILNETKEKFVNLAAFTSTPMPGNDEKCKEAFLRRHEVNAAICQGDAADQVKYLIGKKLKISKEMGWGPIMMQNPDTGKWNWKRLENGEYDHKDQKFTVFEIAEWSMD